VGGVRGWGPLAALALLWAAPAAGDAPPIRAAYFYHYMDASHLDTLAARGFGRAVIHWIPDTLQARGVRELGSFVKRGAELGVDVVPKWLLQSPARLAARPVARRYRWGGGNVESSIPCPGDSLYWRSALLDRAAEFLEADSGVTRLAIDLELYHAKRHHYDAGPCRCAACITEYRGGRAGSGTAPSTFALMGWQEARLERMLTGILAEFSTRFPGVELGVFDLDLDSFVHRALARALTRTKVPTADYCERSYSTAGVPLPSARARLNALGLSNAPLLGGLWLQRFAPRDLAKAVRSVVTASDGYFVFTSYSLWDDPARLKGPYTLLGSRAAYWAALTAANRIP
jgi:hypothetical protein